MKTIAFFNNKGRIGKTTLVYHLAWMFQELGVETVALDLDPQANLTAAFLEERDLEALWLDGETPRTIHRVVERLNERLGDLEEPVLTAIAPKLSLLPGDLGLSLFEDRLTESWPRCLDDKPSEAHDGFRVMSAFYRTAHSAAAARGAELVLVDVGPSLGALNRAALIACDYVVMPLGADLYSLQGLRNLGPVLEQWRKGWSRRLQGAVPPNLPLPSGRMEPVGYVILQHAGRADRPAKAYERTDRIPAIYREKILGEPPSEAPLSEPDPHQLALLKHYRSLMPLAQDAHKPMFFLKPADGAIGGHSEAVQDCYRDFKKLALRIAEEVGLAIDA
jgi:chromosome partitioning protein